MSKQTLTIPDINIKEFKLKLVGDTPLIMHKWDEKAKKMIEAKEKKKAHKAREVRNPEAEFKAATYFFSGGGYGIPARALKESAVAACRMIDGFPMTHARQAFHVLGDLLKLECCKPIMREDMVRVPPVTGGADIRYRPQFDTWSVVVTIKYNADFLSQEQLVNLFNIAGFSCGLLEMRPNAKKSGQFGMFHVEDIY